MGNKARQRPLPALFRIILVATASAGMTGSAQAQSASQIVRIEIRPVNRLAVVGATTFSIPAKRSAAGSVVNSSASYAITTNEENRRITVAIDEPLPEGVSLQVQMDAPSGAQASAPVILSTVPQTAVSGISRLNARDLAIAFSLITEGSAVVPVAISRTVKITLVSTP